MSTAILENETPEYLAVIGTNDAALETASMLREWASDVIANVSAQSDERLMELARDAQYLTHAAFRIRGACGLELKQRIKARLLTEKKSEATHLGKQMAMLAKEVGVERATLLDDIRIAEVFPEAIGGDTEIPRDFYRLACSVADPQSAIEHVEEMLANGRPFSTRDMREYVSRLNNGEDKSKVESEHWAKVLFTEEGWIALHEACRHRSQDLNTVVNQWAVEWRDQHKGARR